MRNPLLTNATQAAIIHMTNRQLSTTNSALS
jgi:hypothetical protein